jgi:hypothetical protein
MKSAASGPLATSKLQHPAIEQNIYDRLGSVCKPWSATIALLGFPALITQEKEVNSPVSTDGDQNHGKSSHIISSHHCQCMALANSSCHLKKKILDTELGNVQVMHSEPSMSR